MDKIFCLGFGSTGTSTLHATAQATGLRCLHDGIWARTTRNQIFHTFVTTYSQVPPEHPGVEEFCHFEDWDFFSDGHYADFELLDNLFPGSYFILNTRRRYNWLTGIYNHLLRNRHDPDYTGNYVNNPTAEFLSEMMRTRITYHRKVIRYFRHRSNFAVVDVEVHEESRVCEVLQTAIGQPVEALHTTNVYKHSGDYESNPAVVETALTMCKIPPNEWHLSLP